MCCACSGHLNWCLEKYVKSADDVIDDRARIIIIWSDESQVLVFYSYGIATPKSLTWVFKLRIAEYATGKSCGHKKE